MKRQTALSSLNGLGILSLGGRITRIGLLEIYSSEGRSAGGCRAIGEKGKARVS